MKRQKIRKYPKPTKEQRERNKKRKKAQRKNAHKATVIKAIIKRAKAFSLEDITAARVLLAEKLGVDKTASPSAMIENLIDGKIAYTLVKASRKKYYETLDLVLAATAVLTEAEDAERAVDYWCERIHLKRTKKTNFLTVMTLAIIDFGTGENGKPDKEKRGLWNRDTHALEYLRSQGVKAGGIAAYQEAHGGGLEEWEEEWRKKQRAGAAGSAAASQKGIESKPTEESDVAADAVEVQNVTADEAKLARDAKGAEEASSSDSAEVGSDVDVSTQLIEGLAPEPGEITSAVMLASNINGVVQVVDRALIKLPRSLGEKDRVQLWQLIEETVATFVVSLNMKAVTDV